MRCELDNVVREFQIKEHIPKIGYSINDITNTMDITFEDFTLDGPMKLHTKKIPLHEFFDVNMEYDRILKLKLYEMLEEWKK